jgi:hypothetical protein
MGRRPSWGALDTTISLGQAAPSTICVVSIHWTLSRYFAKEVAQYTALAVGMLLISNDRRLR